MNHSSDTPDDVSDINSNSNMENGFAVTPIQGINRPGGRIVGGDPNRVVVPPLFHRVTHYDQNLTPEHQYLGDGLCETTGRTIFEENIIHTIPVIFLKLNLMPGQILPIIARSSDVKLLLRFALSKNRAFGVSYKLNKKENTYGTIAEVYEQSMDIDTSQSFQVKAMGHQRYKIVGIAHFPESGGQSIGLAQIKIIPDTTLTLPYNQLCLCPKNRNLRHSDAYYKKDMWLWPSWVYTQFDVNHLASVLTKKIKMLYKDVKILDDPCLLSFQVLRLGIFQPEQVSFLLGMESTNQRLQYEISYWNDKQTMQTFVCNGVGCTAVICDMSCVFPMSLEGPHGTYCNSWGHIHDMITVTNLDDDLSPIIVGRPSTECSWFPGYKWLIVLCPSCHGHLGWRYVAGEDSSIIPRIFYGLSMQAIKPYSGWTNLESTSVELSTEIVNF